MIPYCRCPCGQLQSTASSVYHHRDLHTHEAQRIARPELAQCRSRQWCYPRPPTCRCLGAYWSAKVESWEARHPLAPIVVNALKARRADCPKGQLDLYFPEWPREYRPDVEYSRAFLVSASNQTRADSRHRQKRYGQRPDPSRCCGTLLPPYLFGTLVGRRNGFSLSWGHSSINMTFDLYGHTCSRTPRPIGRTSRRSRQPCGLRKWPARVTRLRHADRKAKENNIRGHSYSPRRSGRGVAQPG
jgi:hypothetical protein